MLPCPTWGSVLFYDQTPLLHKEGYPKLNRPGQTIRQQKLGEASGTRVLVTLHLSRTICNSEMA